MIVSVKHESMPRYILAILLLIFTNASFAQVKPKENSRLNYRIIGFAFPADAQNPNYILEIAKDIHLKTKAFEKNIIITQKSNTNQVMEQVPEFGKHYTWRITYLNKRNKKKKQSELYHFATDNGAEADTNQYRLRIVDKKITDSNLLIILDSKAVIYDLDGNPVWYWPYTKDMVIRDIKPTRDGTFTMITDAGCYEVDYDGNILWQAPKAGIISGDSIEHYHHEFIKMQNGHYMICGQEIVYELLPSYMDTVGVEDGNIIKKVDGKYYKRVFAGTLLEYDNAGKLVWHWKSSKVFSNNVSFATSRKTRLSLFTGTHMNSFFMDENQGNIYISFRNINTVLKISYPSGEVITGYGGYQKENYESREGLPFRHQHSCRIARNGDLFLFNNNTDMKTKGVSTVSFFKEPTDKKDELKKLWDFSCDIDTNATFGTLSGGSVYELPGEEMVLACMGIAGRTFIINKQGQLLWNAIPEVTDINKNHAILSQYKANYLLKNEMFKFLFRK